MFGFRVAAVVASTAIAMAQDPAHRPSFEVASVKPSIRSDAPVTAGPLPGGRYVMVNGFVSSLIGFAYVPGQREILGLPNWVRHARYDVTAKATENVPVADLRLMMQSLLADRFRFRMHPEMRQQSVYRLTFARADETLGPNLHRLDIDCDAIGASVLSGALTVDGIQSAPNGIRHCRTASTIEFLGTAKVTTLKSGGTQLFTLASALGSAIGRPVIDETGLTGFYQYTLAYGAERDGLTGSAVGDAPSVFTAVQEQLGLKLESVRRSVEVLVVDSIERPSPD